MRDTAAMPSEEERKRIALTYCRRVSEGDVGSIVELFAPEATVEDPVGGGPITGYEALGEFYRDTLARTGSQIEPGVARAGQDGTSVALPITVTARVEGQAREIASVDVFEIDDAGKITRMRAYWGMTDVT